MHPIFIGAIYDVCNALYIKIKFLIIRENDQETILEGKRSTCNYTSWMMYNKIYQVYMSCLLIIFNIVAYTVNSTEFFFLEKFR